MAANQFAQAVATDIDIELRIVEVNESGNSRLIFEELVEETLQDSATEGPDFIVSILYGGGELSQVALFNQYGIPFITINSSLDKRILQLTQRPRQKFTHWKAHLSPNEDLTGKQIIEALVTAGEVNTLGIIGGYTHSKVNNHRIRGAIERAEELNISVIPPLFTDWSKQESVEAAKKLLRRVPDFDVLLTTGPYIAAGAIEVLQGVKKKTIVGSFDWAASNVNLIEQGLLEVSLGGHFMEAGWAMIMAYDYMRNHDFAEDTGVLIDTKLGLLNKRNVSLTSPLIKRQKWQIVDFSKYSKCLNPSIHNYDFTLK